MPPGAYENTPPTARGAHQALIRLCKKCFLSHSKSLFISFTRTMAFVDCPLQAFMFFINACSIVLSLSGYIVFSKMGMCDQSCPQGLHGRQSYYHARKAARKDSMAVKATTMLARPPARHHGRRQDHVFEEMIVLMKMFEYSFL